MTDLTKPVRRRAFVVTDFRMGIPFGMLFPWDYLGAMVVMTLYPDCTIGFRRFRCHREVRIHLAKVLMMAENLTSYGKHGRLEKWKYWFLSNSSQETGGEQNA